MKNTPKYNNQSGNGGSNNGTNNYESTPMKDNSAKMHQQQQHGGGHSLSKREQQQQQQQPKDFEVDQTVVTTQFGSHVPPFPYHDQSESYYGPPPGNGECNLTRFSFCLNSNVIILEHIRPKIQKCQNILKLCCCCFYASLSTNDTANLFTSIIRSRRISL